MLAVMTFNAYFFITIILGTGVGYYFFSVFDLPPLMLGLHIDTRCNKKQNNQEENHRNSYGAIANEEAEASPPVIDEIDGDETANGNLLSRPSQYPSNCESTTRCGMLGSQDVNASFAGVNSMEEPCSMQKNTFQVQVHVNGQPRL